ncbi:MAG: hypothetical protein IV088_03955 [Hydrogenophaga sp.]|uniref:hypothetical protein n=1 Tax=Hydrogenophaga sp. TaxID=1904254 RepID=UPI0025C06073|nr:hypothetical protein [Hydrogenophaga sp.]MBT9549982.1 hypothetical protein [Hydrogenophaga sp.]
MDVHANGVVGHLTPGATLPSSQITPSSTNPTHTRQGFTGAFRLVADDVQQGGALGRYAAQALKATDRGGDGLCRSEMITLSANALGDEAAMQAAGSVGPQKYLPALKASQHQGASGHVVFDEKGDRKNAALTLYTVKAGQRLKLAVIR